MSQHDLDLANAAGASFRSDLNSALVALGTLQSGASAPATTFAYMLWADTTNGLLKQRNAANSGWIVRGALAESFVLSRSSNTILAGADLGKAIIATAAFTQTLTAAATLGDGWFVDYNAQGYSIVLDPNGSETIDGATTKTVTGSGRIYCNGSAFFTIGFSSGSTGSPIQPISASVSSNALTISASALNLDFRSTTASSGTVSSVTGTPANLVISSGSTLGTTNGVAHRIAVLAINNAGTIELAAMNIEGGASLAESGTINTTAEGGAGAADSARVAYSTTARTGVAYRVIGFIESTQTTAGTWASAPSLVQGAGGQAGVAVALNARGDAPMFAKRAWWNFDGTGTPAIRRSGNVSSLTDNGTGDYTVNFITAMPHADYELGGSVHYGSSASNAPVINVHTLSTGSVRFVVTRYTDGVYDVATVTGSVTC